MTLKIRVLIKIESKHAHFYNFKLECARFEQSSLRGIIFLLYSVVIFVNDEFQTNIRIVRNSERDI